MENNERQLIEQALAHNIDLRRLYAEHLKIEEQLAALEHRKFLSPEEDLLHKTLKKRKLHGVDRMVGIIQGRPQDLAA